VFLHVEILDQDLLDIGLVDHPARDHLFLLFFLDDDVGGVDLLFVQFARLLFFYGFDGGLLLVAKFWTKGY
jgi:hypothetical protein